jgi:hypothetical protein
MDIRRDREFIEQIYDLNIVVLDGILTPYHIVNKSISRQAPATSPYGRRNELADSEFLC